MISDAAKRRYCEELLGDGEEGLLRFEVNRAGYSLLVEEFPLKTFLLLEALYEKLAALHQQRRHTAAQWLSLHAPGSFTDPAKSKLSLTPHTEEWFAALFAWNPMQATHTRSVVALAKSATVCSICGDEPARNYRLIGPGIPARAVYTLRLCNYCWRIRGEMHNESLALME